MKKTNAKGMPGQLTLTVEQQDLASGGATTTTTTTVTTIGSLGSFGTADSKDGGSGFGGAKPILGPG